MRLPPFDRGVVIAELAETALLAARRMRDQRVGSVVVVRDGRPIGILTDRDLAIRVVAEGRDPSSTAISEIVTYEAATIPSDAELETAVRVMSARGVRRLPIVAGDGKVVGIVTADDLVMLLSAMLGDLGSGIRNNVDAAESR